MRTDDAPHQLRGGLALTSGLAAARSPAPTPSWRKTRRRRSRPASRRSSKTPIEDPRIVEDPGFQDPPIEDEPPIRPRRPRVPPERTLCPPVKAGEHCGPGNGRRTAGGGDKVSHKGWPAVTGVFFIVQRRGGRHAFTGTDLNDEILGYDGCRARCAHPPDPGVSTVVPRRPARRSGHGDDAASRARGRMNELRARAEPLVRAPVELGDLALAFEETTAATVDVHVEGRTFFPLILDDIRAATSSVHINQYGFRPGAIGEQFADALLAKAAEGVAVRVVVDRVGSRPASRAASTSGCGPAGSTSASCARWGASTTASSSSSTAASAGSAARGSRTTSPTAASTTCSCA